MTDPSLPYASVAGDGAPKERPPLSGLAAHRIMFDLFVCVLLAGFAWWLRLRDDQLTYQAREIVRLSAEISSLRGSCSALATRGHDAGGQGR